jgi:RNA polymerase sigma-70 factor, ECF subfamily
MGTYIASVSPFEADLMERIQAREEGAFSELFDRFGNKIFRTALRMLKEEQSAQDALQETFLNVFRAARHFRGDSKVGTWINRIAINVCLEMIRKNRRHDQRLDEDISENATLPDEQGMNPFDTIEQAEIGYRVQRALARLGRKHRPVVRMHDLEGYTIREIAEKLGVAEGTIKSRLFYGREELKRLLTS